MALSFKLYTDAGLTTPLVSNLVCAQKADGSSDPVDKVVYLGSTTANRKIEADSNPGVDQIVVSIVDAAPGSGHPATEVKLATTLLGLGSATGGDPLNLGTSILSGVENAVPIYIRVDDTTGVVGTSTELSIAIAAVRETDTA